ncbi:hypothetical protein RHODGE_RHODGE_04129 [Rhodoplanes serenus]|uniref:Glycosyl transferase family 1 domain-containing protein n=1 Tax=Rhodoplanes serenus TaxID=200615 RepID=A0A3S4CJS5_9BRAD|nr:hypothetical protein RHODGE_RHODGE_04129 [Rhodoplanes serenus]
MGWGVSVVVDQLARNWNQNGHGMAIGCVEHDGSIAGLDITEVDPTPAAIVAWLREKKAHTVVAHTSPFIELLPHLPPTFRRWVWEHGDPTPAMFSDSASERLRTRLHKIEKVYPAIDGVVAISKFIRHDIEWPDAHVVSNGCDHIVDRGCKQIAELTSSGGRPLRVGTLMRLGRGEASYKGNALFCELAARAHAGGLRAEFLAMGRGTPEDAEALRAQGIAVKLNGSDAERLAYLRGLDVFVSPSLWEGFNLPLVEAQAAGTLGAAFDTGAHPEVTPFVFSDLNELLVAIARYAGSPELLWRHSRLCYHFVRDRFSWGRAAEDVSKLLCG